MLLLGAGCPSCSVQQPGLGPPPSQPHALHPPAAVPAHDSSPLDAASPEQHQCRGLLSAHAFSVPCVLCPHRTLCSCLLSVHCLLSSQTYSVLMSTQYSCQLNSHTTLSHTNQFSYCSILSAHAHQCSCLALCSCLLYAHAQLCAHAYSVSCIHPSYGSTHYW